MKRVRKKSAHRASGDDIRRTACITKTSRPVIVIMALVMCTLPKWLLAPSGLFANMMKKGDSTSVNANGNSEPNSSDTNVEPQHVPSYPPLSHPNCQIIYVVGAEGSMHHGATDVIKRFAERQVDSKGENYSVYSRSTLFRKGIQWYTKRRGKTVSKDVSENVRRNVTDQLCPPDGRRHVIIEDTSFPSGVFDMGGFETASDITSSLKETPQPVNLTAFALNFASYADVRFIVLERPYINTVTSHSDWHGGPDGHSMVVLGFLKYFAELFGGRRTVGGAPWTVLCVDQFRASRNKNDRNATTTPRDRVLAHLSHFLQWHHPDCPNCFEHWRDSKKDPEEVVGKDNYKMLLDKREELRGIWPPKQAGDGIPEQDDCPLL